MANVAIPLQHWTLNWKAAVWTALIAGAVFVVLEMLMVALFMGEGRGARHA